MLLINTRLFCSTSFKKIEVILNKIEFFYWNYEFLAILLWISRLFAYAEEIDIPVFQRVTHLELKGNCVDLSSRAPHV